MSNRKYYSIRTGKNPNANLPLSIFKNLFSDLFKGFEGKEYFTEAFGTYYNFDFSPGYFGENVEAQVFKILRKKNLWPIPSNSDEYSEDDLFDMIEFLYDHISKPVTYSQEGYTTKYDKEAGQKEYREEINSLLADYGDGFELSSKGEILILGEVGLSTLLEAEIPSYDPENIDKRVERARIKFRRAKSTIDERKDAIHELANVLEFMRDKAKKYLEEDDEKNIFNIANNYDLRHHNSNQKTKYDNAIWYSWIFYYYLATIHALVRIIKKNEPDT
jgi:hypothetical protein